MKILCDTNVLISGILFNGPPRTILRLAARGTILNFISPAILEETEEVLLRPKFNLSPEQVSGILQLFCDTFELIHPTQRLKVISRDPDDNRILEAALAAKVDFLISGDNHLLDLKKWKGIKILSPTDFMKTHKEF